MQSSPASRHFLPLRFKYSPEYPVLKHNLWSSLSVTDQVSHPYKTKSKVLSFQKGDGKMRDCTK
jgi:hypothetical protein